MVKNTSINLDDDLYDQAKSACRISGLEVPMNKLIEVSLREKLSAMEATGGRPNEPSLPIVSKNAEEAVRTADTAMEAVQQVEEFSKAMASGVGWEPKDDYFDLTRD